MYRRPPGSKRADTVLPYSTLFRAAGLPAAPAFAGATVCFGRKRASSWTATALVGRFLLVEQRRQIDRIGERDPVEDRGGVVADPQHQAAQAAFGFGQAILAMFVRVARRAGDERERAARQANEIAIADVDRRQGELIAAVEIGRAHV